jgi:hypothetical protein
MSWLRIDDTFDEHPKIEPLTDKAFRLHMAGLLYCSRQLTDGFVPLRVLPKLAGYAKRSLIELVDAGLWHPHGDGYKLHDYLDYQRSREQVLADRAAAADRQRKAREKSKSGRGHGGLTVARHSVTHGVTHGEQTPLVTVVVTVPLSTPIPSQVSTATQRDRIKTYCDRSGRTLRLSPWPGLGRGESLQQRNQPGKHASPSDNSRPSLAGLGVSSARVATTEEKL